MHIASFIFVLLGMAVLGQARSCRNPNTCRNNGECITPKSGRGFECLCAAGFKGKRCEYVATPQNFLQFGECEYLIVERPTLQYKDAVDACRRSGGDLAFIGNEELNNFLGTTQDADEQKVARWIGLKRNRQGHFQWRTPNAWDDVFSYAAWAPGYPGINDHDRCVFQDTRRGEVVWLVDECKKHRRYICQICPSSLADSSTKRRRRRRGGKGRIASINDEHYCGEVLEDNALSTFVQKQTDAMLNELQCSREGSRKTLTCEASFQGDAQTYTNTFKCKRGRKWKVVNKGSEGFPQ